MQASQFPKGIRVEVGEPLSQIWNPKRSKIWSFWGLTDLTRKVHLVSCAGSQSQCWSTTHSLSCVPRKARPFRTFSYSTSMSFHTQLLKKGTTIKEKETKGHEFERKRAGAGGMTKGGWKEERARGKWKKLYWTKNKNIVWNHFQAMYLSLNMWKNYKIRKSKLKYFCYWALEVKAIQPV